MPALFNVLVRACNSTMHTLASMHNMHSMSRLSSGNEINEIAIVPVSTPGILYDTRGLLDQD